MIVLFGSHGYIGSALAAELNARKLDWQAGDWRRAPLRLSPFTTLVINAAAYIPKPSVAACDAEPAQTITSNAIWPARLSVYCRANGIPFAQISTGCLWNDGLEHDEESPPQRGFGGHCGFYVGTKLCAEEAVRHNPQHYIWRVRLPYDEVASPKNYLSKLAAFPQVWDQENSASHRADFAKAALDLWKIQAPWGTYHLVNPGALKASDVAIRMQGLGIITHHITLVENGLGACRLSVAKALATGITIRTAEAALKDAITRWTA